MTKKISWQNYLLLYFTFMIYSAAPVFSKFAALQTEPLRMLLWLAGEVVVLGIYAIFWQQVLKRFQLVTAMSNKGVTLVYSLLWSVLLFHEQITLNNILGVILVLTGIIVVSYHE